MPGDTKRQKTEEGRHACAAKVMPDIIRQWLMQEESSDCMLSQKNVMQEENTVEAGAREADARGADRFRAMADISGRRVPGAGWLRSSCPP